MKINPILSAAILTLMLTSCGGKQKLTEQLASSRDSVAMLSQQVEDLNAQIELLKFPADQRLQKIKSLIVSKDYAGATSQIEQLRTCFPNSAETAQCDSLQKLIAKYEAEQKAEQERIKALGFKGLAQKGDATIGVNKVVISNLTTGTKYKYNSVPSALRVTEEMADRGTKFLLGDMTVTSTSQDPNLPAPAVYAIKGDKMTFVSQSEVDFARWNDFAKYLDGTDEVNDFAKTGTIKFKLGCQVLEEILSGPYAVVLKKDNQLYRGRISDFPRVKYKGDMEYKNTLEMSDFDNEYQLVKIFNL